MLDNIGAHAELVHRATVEDVVTKWPRMGWSGCFAGVVRKEMELKPWAHTSALGEGLADAVEGNEVMAAWD